MKRIVSLWFPKLTADRLARPGQSPTPQDWSAKAAATVVRHDGCPRLAALNAHARNAGLRPHMRLADARALVPDLVTAAGEPQADYRLIESVASWCDRYTPWVAIDPLGGALAEEGSPSCSTGGFGGDAGLLLDVTGCAHLFGNGEAGERALLADLTQRLARHDLTCRAAMADTAGAAWALARFAERQADLFCPQRGHREALAPLPVEGLRLDSPVIETFLKLGLIPGDGGAWLLPRTIGMSRACELLFTGDVIDAATAAEWGLVGKVTPAAELMDAALALAEKIALQPPHALRLAKSLLKQGQTTSYDTLMEMSAAAQAISHLTHDHMEGVDALLEKRQANFTGE